MKGCPQLKGRDSSADQMGIIPLSVREIFRSAHQRGEEDIAGNQGSVENGKVRRQYSISVSYLEIYNECVNDLIEPANKNLEVRESISNGIYINRLAEKKVGSFEEVMNYMQQGDEFRNIAATKLNELSSRSHTVFRISISSQENVSDSSGISRGKMKISQLNLVDLAGSEGASKTQAEGLRLREGQNINRSLLALSNVINRLSSQGGSGKSFINYRDSKLTRILQSSLGGNSQTAIICTMTQTYHNHQETVNTLLFG
jgi:centromeric protein E